MRAQRDIRPSLAETRKRLDDKKNESPRIPPVNNSVNKINDRPANNMIDKPVNKTTDKPVNRTIGKPADKITGKNFNRTIEKPIDKNFNNPSGKKTYKAPIDRNSPIGGLTKPNRLDPPKEKNTVSPRKKKPEDRGNPTIDKTDNKGAFKQGPLPLGGATRKDLPPKSSAAKIGGNLKRTPPGSKTGGTKQFGPKPLTADNLLPSARNVDLKKQREQMNHQRFEERVKSGDLDAVTKGEIAKKLDLADQYKHMRQGDVARRMDLQRHAAKNLNPAVMHNATIKNLKGIHPRPGFYYGRISPVYVNHCFKYHYYGPAFFAGVCWYPHWNPWVVWSWGYHIHPFWDPRPLWCRPVIYQPYIVWNYWAPPLWQPLPEAACGTWVDVKPVVVEPEQFDLQLLAVRMVDPGHPEEKLGPRYRVWFRNNSPKPIIEPFSVMLFAGNDKRFGDDLPRGGVRVTSIEAGDTQSVDIRLPIEVYTMNRDAQGQPAPFEFLHFFVDANREVNDVNLANNGAVVPRDEMLPVDPAAFELDPVQSAAGGELVIAGEGFGPQPGQVLLHINGKEEQAEIAGWYDLGVKIVLPKLEIVAPTEADVIVIRGDGAAANPLKVTLLPDQGGPALEIPAER